MRQNAVSLLYYQPIRRY